MRVDVELVKRGLCSSRQEAKELLAKGHVLIDGLPVTKGSKDILPDKKIELLSSRKYVGRGGEKLEGIFYSLFQTKENITSFLKNKIALDIGSSTGGFTDFLLQHSITKVVCVDVGTNQLHTTLRNDSRVELHENTDIREFANKETFDIIVADVSFIPLHKISETVLTFGNKGTYFFLLFKPQFEVGKGNLKKGIVKDERLATSLLDVYTRDFLEKGCHDIRVEPCSIKGGDGNQEYFITFTL